MRNVSKKAMLGKRWNILRKKSAGDSQTKPGH